MLAVMIPGDPCAEQRHATVASGGRFRSPHGWNFSSAHGSQRGKAREFVSVVQVKAAEIETTDEHR